MHGPPHPPPPPHTTPPHRSFPSASPYNRPSEKGGKSGGKLRPKGGKGGKGAGAKGGKGGRMHVDRTVTVPFHVPVWLSEVEDAEAAAYAKEPQTLDELAQGGTQHNVYCWADSTVRELVWHLEGAEESLRERPTTELRIAVGRAGGSRDEYIAREVATLAPATAHKSLQTVVSCYKPGDQVFVRAIKAQTVCQHALKARPRPRATHTQEKEAAPEDAAEPATNADGDNNANEDSREDGGDDAVEEDRQSGGGGDEASGKMDDE